MSNVCRVFNTKKRSATSKCSRFMWFRACEYSIVIPLTIIMLVSTYVSLTYVVQIHWFGLDSTFNSTTNKSTTTMRPQTEIVIRRHRLTNLHFVLMPLGLYLISGISMLMFRICCCYSRFTVKILHMILHIPAIVTSIDGYAYIEDFHRNIGTPHNARFYGFHSWLGIVVIFLHMYQFVSGIIIFLVLPKVRPLKTIRFRAMYTPYHVFFGMAEFFFVVQVFATGFCDAEMQLNPWEGYPMYGTDSYEYDLYVRRMPNMRVVVVLLTLSCVLMFHSLIREDFRHRGRILLTLDHEFQTDC